jgi:hypothetical protein
VQEQQAQVPQQQQSVQEDDVKRIPAPTVASMTHDDVNDAGVEA